MIFLSLAVLIVIIIHYCFKLINNDKPQTTHTHFTLSDRQNHLAKVMIDNGTAFCGLCDQQRSLLGKSGTLIKCLDHNRSIRCNKKVGLVIGGTIYPPAPTFRELEESVTRSLVST